MRPEGWEERLLALVTEHQHTPHAWGTHDCAQFAGLCVEAITGTNIAGPWRDTYHTEDEAEAVLAQVGGLEGWLRSALGDPVAPLCARRGDLLLGPLSEGGPDGVAVCVGRYAVAPGFVWQVELDENNRTDRLAPVPGLVRHDLSRFHSAYRVE